METEEYVKIEILEDIGNIEFHINLDLKEIEKLNFFVNQISFHHKRGRIFRIKNCENWKFSFINDVITFSRKDSSKEHTSKQINLCELDSFPFIISKVEILKRESDETFKIEGLNKWDINAENTEDGFLKIICERKLLNEFNKEVNNNPKIEL